MPRTSTTFKPGKEPGPGRPKGSSGRTQALAVIDSILIEGKAELRKRFQAAFKEDPIGFWEKYGQPLLPKEAILDVKVDADAHSEITVKLDSLSIEALEHLAYPDTAGTDRPSKTRKDRSGS